MAVPRYASLEAANWLEHRGPLDRDSMLGPTQGVSADVDEATRLSTHRVAGVGGVERLQILATNELLHSL